MRLRIRHQSPTCVPDGPVIRTRSTVAAAVVALLATAVVAGCTSDPGNIFVTNGPNARMLADLTTLVFWLSVPIFILVEGLLIYTAIRFRRRPADGAALPPQTHGNNRLETAWTIAPALIFAIVAIPTISTIFSASGAAPASAGAPLHVTVIGHQWWWEFQYPDANPKVVVADELHVPVGQPVDLTIQTADVIHSFWVPKLAGKIDAMPNQNNEMWLIADTAGTYRGQCAEFCGTSHANMRFYVVADAPAAFNTWLKGQQQNPTPPTSGQAQLGYQMFTSTSPNAAQNTICWTCHTINGDPKAKGVVGPNLTHVASRSAIAGAILPMDTDHLKQWLHDPPGVKPGSIMPNLNLTQQQIDALTAYLQTLK